MHGSEHDRIGGSRREFLKTAAIAGGSAALAPAGSAWAAPGELPTVTLGKTGQKVPALGMGTSWAVAPSFVQAALAAAACALTAMIAAALWFFGTTAVRHFLLLFDDESVALTMMR